MVNQAQIDSLPAAGSSSQDGLMRAFQSAQEGLAHPGFNAGSTETEALSAHASEMLETYKELERFRSLIGMDAPHIDKLMEYEAAGRERELSQKFSAAAAHFGFRCESSIDEIKSAFGDKRVELVEMDKSFDDALKSKEKHQGSSNSARFIGIFVFTRFFSKAVMTSETQLANEAAESATTISKKVDTEVNRWKLAQPTAPAA